jgi:hypothetical protein
VAEELTLVIFSRYLIEIYPACATFLGKGNKGEIELFSKLVQGFGLMSVRLVRNVSSNINII